MEKEKIERINYLARKSKVTDLSPDEKREQQKLRNEYRNEFRKGFENILGNTYVIDEKGNKTKLIIGKKEFGNGHEKQ